MGENVIYIKDKKHIVCGRYISESGMYFITIDEGNTEMYNYFKILKNDDEINYEEVDAKTKQEFNKMFYINTNNIYEFRDIYDEVDVFKNRSNSKEEQVLLKKALAVLAIKLPNIKINNEAFKEKVKKLDVSLKTPLDDKELMYANGYLESNGSKVTVLDKYSEDFKLHTLTHELLHLASLSSERKNIKTIFGLKKHGLCKGTFGIALDEGLTDALASKATGYETEDVYFHEVNMAKAIYKIIGDKLIESYFNTDSNAFIEEFTKYTGDKDKTISMMSSMDLALKWQINSQKKNKSLCMTTFVARSENIILDAYKNKIFKEIENKTRSNNEIIKDVVEFKELFIKEKYENVYMDYLASRSFGINKVNEGVESFINEVLDKTKEVKKEIFNHVNIAKSIEDENVR